MAHLAEGRKGYVWDRLGLDGPFTHDAARSWIGERASVQRVAGDRVRLYLPPYLMPHTPDYGSQPGEPFPFARGQGEQAPVLVYLPRAVDTWTGRVYLRDDPDDLRRRWVGVDEGARIEPLALVALVARLASYYTGCTGAEASAWVLCDEPIPAREMVAEINTGMPCGVHIFTPNWQINAGELGKLYVRQRRWLTRAEQRLRHPKEHTGVLIEYVERVRPYKGTHAENMPWDEVWREWNAAYPEWAYSDSDSMQEAYRAARKVRERLGYLPPLEKGE